MNHASFSAAWLRLREPQDHLARAAAAAAAAAQGDGWIGALRRGRGKPTLEVLDIACGSGATLRQLASRLGGAQHWQVFDHDEALLQAWPEALAAWAKHRRGCRVAVPDDPAGALHVACEGFSATVQRHRLDLAHGLDSLPFAGADLLTATALLDLVSMAWLASLIERAARARLALAFGLVVDGRIEWNPPLEGDALVAQAFAAHQGRDKGFAGPALGAQAPQAARSLLARAGFAVEEARSDWVLNPGGRVEQHALHSALIEDMAAAASEQQPEQARAVARWRQLRAAAVEQTALRVGHVDLVAVPRDGHKP